MSEAEQLTIDDYQLVNCIATGNVSQVWEVQQMSTSQTFAMKLLLDEALEDVEQRNTMKHEAKVGKALEHPNLIQVFDVMVTKKQAYIIMELFKAANLKAIIRSSLLDVHVRIGKLAEATSSACAYMHEKGWIHKDIKPDNILMTKGSEVRVIDFSLASKADSAIGRMMTKKSNIAIQGTRTYIAPELIKRERLTPKADIYSLGISLFECLTGRPPFTGTNPNALLMSHIQERPPAPSEIHNNVSPQADALIARMLSKKPADRHENMQEVFTEVRGINFFKMDPVEYDRQQKEEAEREKEVTIDQRMDSRADHEYTQKYGHKPKTPAKPKPQTPPPEPERRPASPAPAQPAAHAPQPPPGMAPQMPPGMMPHPGMPQYPQMPMHPGMMPPGAMPPGMMPPGMPPQGAPAPMPGQPQPPPGMPGQPPQQPQAPPQPPQQQPPQPQQPAAGAPPEPKDPKPAPPAPVEESHADPETPEDIDWLNVS